MAYIDPEGMFGGDRMDAISDPAKFAWPWFWCAANTVGRVELNYRAFIKTAFRQFKRPPTEKQFWEWVSEFHEQFLMFVYEDESGKVWGQWDVSEKYLPKYKTKADEKTPAPNAKDFLEWKKRYSERKKSSVAGKCRVLTNSENFQKVSTNSPVSIGVVVDLDEGEKEPVAPAPGLFPDEPKTGKKRQGMNQWQAERFRQFLELHPKRGIQTKSAENLWGEKVTTQGCVDFLLDSLRRECKSDTTFMYGPGKWLADHLVLYANRVEVKAPAINPQATIYTRVGIE